MRDSESKELHITLVDWKPFDFECYGNCYCPFCNYDYVDEYGEYHYMCGILGNKGIRRDVRLMQNCPIVEIQKDKNKRIYEVKLT